MATTPNRPAAPTDRAREGGEEEDRERTVRRIFSEIAPRYDLLNHVLSLGIDRRWRRRAIERLGWERRPGGIYLDACAGTFDLSLALTGEEGFRGRVVATDFAVPMLAEGREKVTGHPIVPVGGDALGLPFSDRTFDGATVGFGVRNLADLDLGLHELFRVLRPGGRLVVLEFTLPPNPLVRGPYLLYFTRILPLVGRIVSGHPWAYSYLPASVRAFPGPSALGERLRTAGFGEVEWSLLTLGIAAIHVGTR